MVAPDSFFSSAGQAQLCHRAPAPSKSASLSKARGRGCGPREAVRDGVAAPSQYLHFEKVLGAWGHCELKPYSGEPWPMSELGPVGALCSCPSQGTPGTHIPGSAPQASHPSCSSAECWTLSPPLVESPPTTQTESLSLSQTTARVGNAWRGVSG